MAATLTGNAIATPVDDSASSSLEVVVRSNGFYAQGSNVDFKTYFPTLDPTFRFATGNLFRTGNLGINITGGVLRLNTLSDMDMTIARNGSTKIRLKSGTVNISLPTYADDAAAGTAGLVSGDLYIETSTRRVLAKS